MAYTKKKRDQLNRVRSLIRRAEKRGYVFPEALKNELASYHTNRLRAMTPEKLYGMATAISESTGKIVSGTERRKEEAAEASRKSAETRRRRSLPSKGYMIWNDLNTMINTYDTKGAEYLRNLLESEKRQHGFLPVLKALSDLPEDAIANAQSAIHYEEDSNTVHRAFVRLADLIKGTVPNYKEVKTYGKLTDAI